MKDPHALHALDGLGDDLILDALPPSFAATVGVSPNRRPRRTLLQFFNSGAGAAAIVGIVAAGIIAILLAAGLGGSGGSLISPFQSGQVGLEETTAGEPHPHPPASDPIRFSYVINGTPAFARGETVTLELTMHNVAEELTLHHTGSSSEHVPHFYLYCDTESGRYSLPEGERAFTTDIVEFRLRPGESVSTRGEFTIPADAPAGDYHLVVYCAFDTTKSDTFETVFTLTAPDETLPAPDGHLPVPDETMDVTVGNTPLTLGYIPSSSSLVADERLTVTAFITNRSETPYIYIPSNSRFVSLVCPGVRNIMGSHTINANADTHDDHPTHVTILPGETYITTFTFYPRKTDPCGDYYVCFAGNAKGSAPFLFTKPLVKSPPTELSTTTPLAFAYELDRAEALPGASLTLITYQVNMSTEKHLGFTGSSDFLFPHAYLLCETADGTYRIPCDDGGFTEDITEHTLAPGHGTAGSWTFTIPADAPLGRYSLTVYCAWDSTMQATFADVLTVGTSSAVEPRESGTDLRYVHVFDDTLPDGEYDVILSVASDDGTI